jgi:tryptophan halogenase
VFDGRVFRVGNAAGFLEPLEATAISTAIVQIRKACEWIRAWTRQGGPGEPEIEAYNRTVISASIRDSLFLVWHYACGSHWQTPFWQHARSCFAMVQGMQRLSSDWHMMQKFIDAGRQLPAAMLGQDLSPQQWTALVMPQMKVYAPFGTFSELNFAQVGHGIGFYDGAGDG